jgi:D-glycero-D-manno-heptose 1,7-bisphosphate phosphatase
MSQDLNSMPKWMILDRDGTLIEHVHHLVDQEKVRLLPNVGQVLKNFSEKGVRFVVVTNQSVIGRGLASASTVNDIHKVIDVLLSEFGVRIEAYFVCPHLATALCLCRKPRIQHGLSILQDFSIQPSDVWVIGDQESDMEFANNLGSTGIKINASSSSESSVASMEFKSWSDFHLSTQKEFW